MTNLDPLTNLYSKKTWSGIATTFLACLGLSSIAGETSAQQVSVAQIGAVVDLRRCDTGAPVDKKNLLYRLQVRNATQRLEAQRSETPTFGAVIFLVVAHSGSSSHFSFAWAPDATGRSRWCLTDLADSSPSDANLPRIQFVLEQSPNRVAPFKTYLEASPILGKGPPDGLLRLPVREGLTFADLVHGYLTWSDVRLFADFALEGYLRVDTLFVGDTPRFSRHRTATHSMRYRNPNVPELDFAVVRKELIDVAAGNSQSATAPPPTSVPPPTPVPPSRPMSQQGTTTEPASVGLKDYLVKLDHPDFQRLTPQQVRHFGYCGNSVAEKVEIPGQRTTTFKIAGCGPTTSGKIPVKLPGFDAVWVEANEAAIDAKLQVTAIDQLPYPREWKSDRVTRMPRGNLGDLDKGRIDVSLESQFSDCGKRVLLTIKELLSIESNGLSVPRPCQEFNLSISPALPVRATVSSGCQGTRSVDIQQSGARCWRAIASLEAAELALELSGFESTKVSVTTAAIEAGSVVVSEAQLLASLRPKWTLSVRGTPEGLPPYKTTSVRYMRDGAACGDSMTWTGRPPSVGEARCTRLPDRIKVLFTLDVEAAAHENFPPRAFLSTLERDYPLDRTPMQALTLLDVTRELPVRFTADKGKEYDQAFGKAFANEIYSGVFVYQPTNPVDACDPLEKARSERFVRFVPDRDDTQRPPMRMRWPITGRVVDKDKRALSQCAVGVVQGPENEPYWTFEPKPARAAGKRKLVIISVSPDFVAGGPGASRQAALRASLQQLVDLLAENSKKTGSLSAVDVYTVTGADNFIALFTGEEAAMEPQAVKAKLGTAMAAVGANIPNTVKFEELVELKHMSELILIMHGAGTPTNESKYPLEFMAGRLGKDRAKLVLSAENCKRWLDETRQSIDCAPLSGGDNAKMKQVLDAALSPRGPN